MDWYSRYVLSWRLSNTMDTEFYLDALEEALSEGTPDIFNTDQGAQFTSEAFTGLLERQGGTVSMDGKGSYTDNLFMERLWRSLKYEEVYLKAYADGREARSQIGEYFRFYNTQRPHQALEYRTPAEVYTSEREADMVHSQGTLTLTKGVKTAGPDLSLPSFLSNGLGPLQSVTSLSPFSFRYVVIFARVSQPDSRAAKIRSSNSPAVLTRVYTSPTRSISMASWSST